MANLTRQSKGAIAEHYVVMRLLARGYVAANINFTVENSKSIDIFCSNDSLGHIIGIQVKSSFDNSKSFNIGLTHNDFCTNGVFDDAKAMQSLNQKIVCPWIFVNVDTSATIPEFRTFILSAEDVIRLTFESEKWYITEVPRSKVLQGYGQVALTLDWVEGKDTSAITTGKRQRKAFINPFKQDQFFEAWHNLGLE